MMRRPEGADTTFLPHPDASPVELALLGWTIRPSWEHMPPMTRPHDRCAGTLWEQTDDDGVYRVECDHCGFADSDEMEGGDYDTYCTVCTAWTKGSSLCRDCWEELAN